jgi:CubicO group peptidase (beta-lactamase class C family)
MVLSRRAALGCGLAMMISVAGRRAWGGATPLSGPLSTGEVERLLRQHNVPGAGLAILEAGEIVAVYSYGFARDKSLVSEATRFQAASISKTVNALLVLTLVRDRAIKLDDPVNTHLKSFTLSGPDADQVTVRMLLNHSGGTSVEGFTGYTPGQVLPSLHQILAGEEPANNRAIKVVRALGSYAYAYSGGGTMVLQQLIIDVTGQSYQDAATLRVLAPLGMAASSFEQPPSETGNLAHAHGPDGQPYPGGYKIHPELAAAGLWTTPSDICRMLRGIKLFDRRWAGRNSPSTDCVSDGETGRGRRRPGSLRQQRRPYQPLRREPWLPRRVWTSLECRKGPGGDDQWRQRRTGP